MKRLYWLLVLFLLLILNFNFIRSVYLNYNGEKAYQNHNFSKAVLSFKSSQNLLGRYNYANLQYLQKNYEEAKNIYLQLLSLASGDLKFKILHNLGNTFYRLGQLNSANAVDFWEKSVEYYQKALDLAKGLNYSSQQVYETQKNLEFVLNKLKEKQQKKESQENSQKKQSQKNSSNQEKTNSNDSRKQQNTSSQKNNSSNKKTSQNNQGKGKKSSSSQNKANRKSSQNGQKNQGQQEKNSGSFQNKQQDNGIKQQSQQSSTNSKESNLQKQNQQPNQQNQLFQELQNYAKQLQQQQRQYMQNYGKVYQPNLDNFDNFFDDPFFDNSLLNQGNDVKDW